MIRFLVPTLLAASVAHASLVGDVRSAARSGDLAAGERLVTAYRQSNGVTPELAAAMSWLGRGALAKEQYDKAAEYAAEARELALELLKGRELDDDRHLPTALGASIEVEAQAMAARGELSEAIALLNEEVERWRKTSIRTRIHKNINLLSLEGKPAPPLELAEYVGPAPARLESLKGKVLLLFFWAHWCGDCKAEASVLACLQQEYGDRGLVIIGPTKRYGFAARGEDASPAEELAYIAKIRDTHYASVSGMSAPVSEDTFANYGSSTTPTIVLVDREGVVRLYHPGEMTYEELAPKVEALF